MVVDSDDRPAAGIEVTEVRVVPPGRVDLVHAVDEGEGYTGVTEWRAGHGRFRHRAEIRAALDDPGFAVDDETQAVLERLRLVADLRHADRWVTPPSPTSRGSAAGPPRCRGP
ncbi:hypothetical protein GCM10010279_11950 [Streptomyces mutabilis]|nr:hypothetical protein GCM10010279_11950 [Streptomyces mutabilis]